MLYQGVEEECHQKGQCSLTHFLKLKNKFAICNYLKNCVNPQATQAIKMFEIISYLSPFTNQYENPR